MDRNNQPMCYILVATDLTEENRLIQEAQSANAAKSNFLSNISHEIRTPINVISGMNELILRECKDKSILKYAENINVASRNLTSLINDVLDFSKIESGKIDLVSNDFDIGVVLNDSYNLFLSLAQKKKQTFSLECNSATPSILTGDEVRLKQILSNLISNAVKYTPEGGSINVSVDYKEMSEERILLVFNVKDTGIGIQPEDLPNLFQNFQRFELSRNRTIQGSGLGLAITKNLVTLMRGTISVESTYGKGSSFTVRVPFNVVDHAPIGEVKEHFKAGSSEKYKVSFSAEKARVLAVDDVQMNLDVFVGLLKKTNIKIDCALSGKDALALTKVNRYDMIFLDHMMPEMDGIDVLKRLKADIANPNQETPVIMITANALMGADRKYLDDGFDDYLSKPINPSALENMVLKHLPDELISKEILVEEPAAAVVTPEAVGVVTDTPKVPEELKKDFISSLDFLDTAAGLQFAAGDMDFYKQILLTYLNEDKRASLNELKEKKDWKNYQIVAHSLKGTSLTIGAPLLSEAAKGLEFAVKENRLEYIEEHHDEVIEMYGVLLNQLSEVLIEE
jgi:CheY-like chemotaxis protein/nitrogen-specific signal transduction histidine kinase